MCKLLQRAKTGMLEALFATSLSTMMVSPASQFPKQKGRVSSLHILTRHCFEWNEGKQGPHILLFSPFTTLSSLPKTTQQQPPLYPLCLLLHLLQIQQHQILTTSSTRTPQTKPTPPFSPASRPSSQHHSSSAQTTTARTQAAEHILASLSKQELIGRGIQRGNTYGRTFVVELAGDCVLSGSLETQIQRRRRRKSEVN